MTPFVGGCGGLPRLLTWELEGNPLARDAAFVLEFFLDRTPILVI